MTAREKVWVFLGLVVPIVPLLVAKLVVGLQYLAPTYGAAVALVLAAVAFMFLLMQPSMTQERRKTIKAGLDTLWNVWAYLTTIALFTSAAFIEGDKLKLDNLLKHLTPSRITWVFAVVGTTAAARFSVAAAEWVQALRAKAAKPAPRQLITSGYPFEDEYGYSRAVRVGDQVFVSGTTARPPHLDGNAHAQTRAALALVADALAQAGAELRHVVRTVVYIVDMADAPLIAQAHAEVFGQVRPASTLVQVAALTPAAARVEVEATAAVAD